MNLSRLARIVVAVSVMAIGPVGSVANAQTTSAAPVTCAIAQGPLTPQQESVVNDYEVQVARANAKHTPIPTMPDEVFVLIGCISPASQTGGQAAPTSVASTSVASTTTSSPPPAAASSSGSSSGSSAATFTCPPNGLSKAQLSQINDYEVLVARANAKHTPVPEVSPDVAALLTCQ